jgi:hypothetical protein
MRNTSSRGACIFLKPNFSSIRLRDKWADQTAQRQPHTAALPAGSGVRA